MSIERDLSNQDIIEDWQNLAHKYQGNRGYFNDISVSDEFFEDLKLGKSISDKKYKWTYSNIDGGYNYEFDSREITASLMLPSTLSKIIVHSEDPYHPGQPELYPWATHPFWFDGKPLINCAFYVCTNFEYGERRYSEEVCARIRARTPYELKITTQVDYFEYDGEKYDKLWMTVSFVGEEYFEADYFLPIEKDEYIKAGHLQAVVELDRLISE